MVAPSAPASAPTASYDSEVCVAVVARRRSERRRVAETLARDGLDVLAAAPRANELSTQVVERQPDAVVIASTAPGDDLLQQAQLVRERLPDAHVVLVAELGGRQAIRSALGAGADGFVVHERLEPTLAVTVRSVCSGQLAVPPELRGGVERRALSHRERQILGLVVLGFTNAGIAAKLCLAESTVKSHLSSAFAKLGVRSRNQATALILDPEAGVGAGILSLSGQTAALLSDGAAAP
jgi:two-component system response regulator DesR